MRFHLLIQSMFAALLVSLSITSAAEGGAVICRSESFVGLGQLTEEVHELLGKDTTDISRIKLYISKDKGVTYIQSNFKSADPDNSGQFSEFPTKIRTNEARDLRSALRNIIYWGKQPIEAELVAEKALESLEVYIDRASIDQNGRVPVDIEGAGSIRLVSKSQTVPHGELSTLRLRTPPPALVETIDGCCFKGRPPGRATSIVRSLSQRKIDPSQVFLLPFVVDSGTDSVIAKSATLVAARERTGVSGNDDWQNQFNGALRAAKGGSLLLLTHINGKNVEVLDPAGTVLFSTPLATMRSQAREAGVDLILFGCDTAAFIGEASDSVGVAGKYNTAIAAARLDKALLTSENVADLLKGIASPDIVIVAYDEAGGNGYAGASGFARVRHSNFFARIFRLLTIRGS
jgi:hypothetical protein